MTATPPDQPSSLGSSVFRGQLYVIEKRTAELIGLVKLNPDILTEKPERPRANIHIYRIHLFALTIMELVIELDNTEIAEALLKLGISIPTERLTELVRMCIRKHRHHLVGFLLRLHEDKRVFRQVFEVAAEHRDLEMMLSIAKCYPDMRSYIRFAALDGNEKFFSEVVELGLFEVNQPVELNCRGRGRARCTEHGRSGGRSCYGPIICQAVANGAHVLADFLASMGSEIRV